MNEEPIIELEGISKSFGEHQVLRDINLKIYPGEFIALLGKSGSGKSTLLNILGLLENSTDGLYRLNGVETSLASSHDKDLLRRDDLGFIFQSSNMLMEESTIKNAAMGLRVQGMPFEERLSRAKDILSGLGLSHRLHIATKNLSGGERQRCAIARAVATRPGVILADEPTGNLDVVNSNAVMEILRDLNESGHTIIVVTHDPDVAAVANRIIHVENGNLREEPAPLKEHLFQNNVEIPEPERISHKKSTVFIDDWIEIVSTLSLKPLRTLLLVLSFALGIGGLILSNGISASATQQVNDRLLKSENTTIRSGFTDERELLTQQEGNVLQYNQQLENLEYVEKSYFLASVAPADVHISRFSSYEDEPPTAIGLISTTSVYLDLKNAKITPTAARNFIDRSVEQLNKSSTEEIEGAVVSRSAALALGLVTTETDPLPEGLSIWVNQERLPVLGIIESEELDQELSPFILVSPKIINKIKQLDVSFYTKVKPGYVQAVSKAVPLALSPAAPASVAVETPSNITSLRADISSDLGIFLAVLSVVLLVLSSLSAATAMYISVQSRTSEIALRRAIGAGKSDVARLFLGEGLLLGLMGGAAGAFLGNMTTLIEAYSKVPPAAKNTNPRTTENTP